MIRSPAGFDGGDRIKRYLDYYQPSYGVMMLSAGQAAAFSPASLFSAGEQGVWYDPSDFSTMFQDSAGTTPVTAVEQPVGLLLDKSQGLTGTQQVADPSFDSGISGWGAQFPGSGVTYAWNSGIKSLTVTRGAGDITGRPTYPVSIVSGTWYKISLTTNAAGVTNSAAFSVVNSFGSASIFSGGALGPQAIGATSKTIYALATSTTTVYIGFWCANSTSVDILSVEFTAVTGNHATQSTTASCPVLSARVNQLVATATLSTQSVTTLAATYTLAFSGIGTITATGTNIGVYSAGSNSLVCTAGTLTLTVVGSVTSADLRVTNTGVGLPAYQAVVTSTNYDTTGFTYYLRFDGSDDSMATATITPGTDKVQVFSGVRKLSDAARGMFAELGNGVGGTNAFNMEAPNAASPTYRWRSGGTVLQETIPSGFAAPITNVLAGTADISAPFVTVRINGVEAATNTATQGTGSYNANILYIGSRTGSSLRFNGNLYSLIVRFGANLDASTVSNTETWVNGKTKAF